VAFCPVAFCPGIVGRRSKWVDDSLLKTLKHASIYTKSSSRRKQFLLISTHSRVRRFNTAVFEWLTVIEQTNKGLSELRSTQHHRARRCRQQVRYSAVCRCSGSHTRHTVLVDACVGLIPAAALLSSSEHCSPSLIVTLVVRNVIRVDGSRAVTVHWDADIISYVESGVFLSVWAQGNTESRNQC